MNAGKLRVFLCGEGSCELGSRFGHPSYQDDTKPGVLHRMLEHVRASGWEVGGARDWQGIRKYKVGRAEHKDTHNVLGAALDALEHGCDVLVFSRDVDADEGRDAAVEEGIRRVPTLNRAPAVVGGVAKPALEGWVLAIMGVRCTEAMSRNRATELLGRDHKVPQKDSKAMADTVERAGLDGIAEDADSLLRWVERARAAMGKNVP